MKRSRFAPFVAWMAALSFAVTASAQTKAATDPGVQGGAARAGSPLASVNSSDGSLQFFQNGLGRFQEIESVSNSPEGNNGLGPRFNFDQCSACHAQPAIGGTGAALNPQFLVAANGLVNAGRNTIPSFITANGPTREARFPFFFGDSGAPNTNAPNGGVEDLFTVSGRSDAGSCSIEQPPFRQALETNNIIYRIPTPVFGAGLIENSGRFNLAGQSSSSNAHNAFGHQLARSITNGNDGTITTFWMEGSEQVSTNYSRARPTTSRWASPTKSSHRIVPCRRRRCTVGCQRTA
jgi:mono/diheme cytochrome c family protein